MNALNPLDYLRTELYGAIFDPQAQYLYKSEEEALYPGQSLDQTMAMPPRFATGEEATTWARDIQRNPKVAALWPKFSASKPINVKIEQLPYGAGARTEMGTDDIGLSDNGFGNSEDSLLHEMAHVIIAREYHLASFDMSVDEGHGPMFTGVYLRLVKEIKGDEAAEKLFLAMKNNNVLITEVTK